jgi:hypothetical protein
LAFSFFMIVAAGHCTHAGAGSHYHPSQYQTQATSTTQPPLFVPPLRHRILLPSHKHLVPALHVRFLLASGTTVNGTTSDRSDFPLACESRQSGSMVVPCLLDEVVDVLGVPNRFC